MLIVAALAAVLPQLAAAQVAAVITKNTTAIKE